MIFPEYDEHGRLKHNGARYTAIKQLHDELTELGISHEIHHLLDGYQICVPCDHKPNGWEGDAIQHFGSYGADRDLIEVYGFGLEAPEGFLTTEEALQYFIEWAAKKEVNT